MILMETENARLLFVLPKGRYLVMERKLGILMEMERLIIGFLEKITFHGGPEFLSVIEGATGKELARTNYISLGTSEDWGDNYYKRSSSYRVGLGNFSGTNTSILICRGVYDKMVLEAWDFGSGKLTKRWRFDTTDGIHGSYAGQGNHSLSVGDVDGDRLDEVVYGALYY